MRLQPECMRLGTSSGGAQATGRLTTAWGARASFLPPPQSPTPLPLIFQASDLPAPSPIEQRWSARSRAPLSPAHSPGGDDLHCWVGIIMYLPEGEAEVEAVRARITKRFWEYNDLCRHKLWQVCWLRVGLGLELGRRQGWGWGREWGPS